MRGLAKASLALKGFSRCYITGAKKHSSTVTTTTSRGLVSTRNDRGDDVYDVVISGGGMVGSAMACCLAADPNLRGKKILLLEAGDRRATDGVVPEHHGARVSSISRGSAALLRGVGAWDHVAAARCRPYRRMQVWDACSDAAITFHRRGGGADDIMAYMVENDVVTAALAKRLDALSDHVEVRHGSEVAGYAWPDPVAAAADWVRLTLGGSGETLRARLLIGADGPDSAARRASGIRTVGWSYEQSAVVAVLHLSEPTENAVAWQRFLPAGPVAMLPLSDTRSSLVWSTGHRRARELLELDGESFARGVNSAFRSDENRSEPATRAGSLFRGALPLLTPSSSVQLPPRVSGVGPGSRAAFPLGTAHAVDYTRPRVVLVGDAAHRVHPLAGQGANLGFGDVACLAQVLSRAAADGRDLGAARHLLEYQTERQRHNVPMMAAVDLVKRLYSTDAAPLVLLRSFGMLATEMLPKLKEHIVAFASK